jgi:Flp pilus assembly protein TadD
MSQLTIEEVFQLAIRHHQAGQLAQAENLYVQILAQQPGHAEALHNLGLIACQMGRYDRAVSLIQQAIALKPDFPEACCNLGVALKNQGQLNEAIGAYRRAVTLRPRYPEAYSNLGTALTAKGQFDEAIAACRQAIALRSNFPKAYNNLGNALKEDGRLDEAIAAFRHAIHLEGRFPEAHNNLGAALREKGEREEAIAVCRKAIALQPNFATAHYNLGNALKDKGQLDEAIGSYRQAIAHQPSLAEAHSNLGVALKDSGELDDAIAACRQAVALQPAVPKGHSNLGVVLKDKGQLDDAIAAFRQAIALNPNYADAHNNLALTLLLLGDFPSGWASHEWRWKCDSFTSPRHHFVQPQWDGSGRIDRTILLHAEQGFGDTIQFIRYVPWVAERCGKVIVRCQPELLQLLHSTPGVAQWLTPGEPLPPFDFHCPLLSLPLAFGTRMQTIPSSTAYLQAETQEIERWRKRFPDSCPDSKLGLAWAGQSAHTNDRNRSVPLSLLVPLSHVPGLNFYSLQKGDRAMQAQNPPGGMKLVDWTQELRDFSDTAALIANLDLVITVDTAVAHLAGAMGKPVWLLLPFVPDWRWMMDREDSPWYPTMRLFRQKAIGQWEEVVERVSEALRSFVPRALDASFNTSTGVERPSKAK